MGLCKIYLTKVLILATGFNVQDFFFPLEIKVKNGVDLMQLWKKEGPAAYKGICCSAAPNLFHLLGPNSVRHHFYVLAPKRGIFI